MAWIGMAMYVAFAVGAPLGTALYSRYGFFAIALATTAIPIACMALVAPCVLFRMGQRDGRCRHCERSVYQA
jgi:predicted MFS family arabinose efflux permease